MVHEKGDCCPFTEASRHVTSRHKDVWVAYVNLHAVLIFIQAEGY